MRGIPDPMSTGLQKRPGISSCGFKIRAGGGGCLPTARETAGGHRHFRSLRSRRRLAIGTWFIVASPHAPRLDVALQRFELGQDRPYHGTLVLLRLRAGARNERGAADLAVHGFQQVLHPPKFTDEFRLLLAGKVFLAAEGLGLFGRAAARGIQLGFQGLRVAGATRPDVAWCTR